MNSSDLSFFLAAHNITAEIVRLPIHTPTVEHAAAALNARTDQIVKSLLFLADSSPLLIIANGTARVNYKRLAEYLRLPRKRVQMADAPMVQEIAGYSVGTMPPFGHKTKLRTLIDQKVFHQSEVYAGGGAIDALMRITPAELARVTAAETVDVAGKS